jgi:hypothetical protein
MKTSVTKIFKIIHFTSLTIVIFNVILIFFSDYSLIGSLAFGIKLLVIFSGLTLFFLHIKPVNKINLYFSIYPSALLLLIIGLIFRGFFGAFLMSIILSPIIPDQKEHDQNELSIYTPYQGLMSSCCYYQVKERRFLIFEKDYGIFESYGSINFEFLKIEKSENEIKLNFNNVDLPNRIIKR